MIFDLVRGGVGWEFNLILVVVFIFAMLIALITHEIAHGVVALKCGDPSAKMAGRLSPNPIRHVDPLGLLSFCLIGLGWAKPVPVNPFNYRNFRRGNFLVSIAGVLTNLVIGFVASLLCYVVWKYSNHMSNVGLYGLFYFFYFLTFINISLVVFNLLPIYPLDGYNALVSFTKPDNRFMRFMRMNSSWILIVVILVLIFTGWIGIIRNGVVDGFMAFWRLMF